MMTDRLNLILTDPGLVENSSAAEHCVHACFQMVFRTRNGGGVPSFGDLNQLMNKRIGKYTYEYALLAQMPEKGFETRVIWEMSLSDLVSDPRAFLLRHYGEEVGMETIRNTDLNQVQEDARQLLDSKQVLIEQRAATREDVVKCITDGFYLMCTVNQRVLQADPGYVAHSIFVFGCSRRGVIIHNPGPPSVERSEITWDLFDRAWAFPNEAARNILAFRPLETKSE